MENREIFIPHLHLALPKGVTPTVVVHAGCYKQDSLMRGALCGELHDRPGQLLIAL